MMLNRWNALGIADLVLASAVAVPPRTLDRWRAGMYPQADRREKVRALDDLYQRLTTSFGEDDAEGLRTWLHADNRYLGGLKPVEALKAGRLDRVEAALIALDEEFFV